MRGRIVKGMILWLDLDGGNLHQRGVQHSASPLHWWTPNWYKYSDDLMSYIRCSASTTQHWRLCSEEFRSVRFFLYEQQAKKCKYFGVKTMRRITGNPPKEAPRNINIYKRNAPKLPERSFKNLKRWIKFGFPKLNEPGWLMAKSG